MGDEVALRFLTDEDVPRSTARVLRDAGFDATDVRDVGLRGKSDPEIFAYAQREGRLLITCDMGFSNILSFPPAENRGIVVVRVSDRESVDRFNAVVLLAVQELRENLLHHLAIVEVGKVGLRG